jgi:hypothetical protein
MRLSEKSLLGFKNVIVKKQGRLRNEFFFSCVYKKKSNTFSLSSQNNSHQSCLPLVYENKYSPHLLPCGSVSSVSSSTYLQKYSSPHVFTSFCKNIGHHIFSHVCTQILATTSSSMCVHKYWPHLLPCVYTNIGHHIFFHVFIQTLAITSSSMCLQKYWSQHLLPYVDKNISHHCSLSSPWRPHTEDKRMVLEYTHGLFIT